MYSRHRCIITTLEPLEVGYLPSRMVIFVYRGQRILPKWGAEVGEKIPSTDLRKFYCIYLHKRIVRKVHSKNEPMKNSSNLEIFTQNANYACKNIPIRKPQYMNKPVSTVSLNKCR